MFLMIKESAIQTNHWSALNSRNKSPNSSAEKDCAKIKCQTFLVSISQKYPNWFEAGSPGSPATDYSVTSMRWDAMSTSKSGQLEPCENAVKLWLWASDKPE